MSAVVLDAGAVSDLADHFQVIGGAHPEALGFEQLARFLELGEFNFQLLFDPDHRGFHALLGGRIVSRRVDPQLLHLFDDLSGQGVHAQNALHLVTKEFDSDHRFVVSGMNLERVASDPELSTYQVDLVALVPDIDQAPDRLLQWELHTPDQPEELTGILGRATEAIDARYGSDNDHVFAKQQ